MSVIPLLSLIFASRPDQTCDIAARWADGTEETFHQGDTLAVYTTSMRHRLSGGDAPTSNSPPWLAWVLVYAQKWDERYPAPPEGFKGFEATETAPAEPEPTAAEPPAAEEAPAPAPAPKRRSKERARKAAAEPAGEPHVVTPADIEASATAAKAADIFIEAEPESTVVSAEDAMAAALAVFLDGNAKAIVARVEGCEDRAQLDAALVAEQDGKARKAVVAAIRKRLVDLQPPAEPDPAEHERAITEAVERILAGKTSEVCHRVGQVGITPAPLDLLTLEQAAVAEAGAKRPRGKVIEAIAARIAALTPAPEGDNPRGATIADADVRPELPGAGLGGSGVELGGDLTGGSLTGGLGTGEGELGGDLTGGSAGGIGGAGRDDTPQGVKPRAGAGCKQPDKVDGWEPGRVLVVVKPHRGEFASWGTCEYRVRCDEDGGYTLLKLTGNRTQKDAGGLFEGKKWPFVSKMLTDLMGIPLDAEGKPTRHHRMTLRRWFALGRE